MAKATVADVGSQDGDFCCSMQVTSSSRPLHVSAYANAAHIAASAASLTKLRIFTSRDVFTWLAPPGSPPHPDGNCPTEAGHGRSPEAAPLKDAMLIAISSARWRNARPNAQPGGIGGARCFAAEKVWQL